MKKIELLNKLANGEEMPKRIKYEGKIYEYDFGCEDYEDDEGYISNWLFDDIEITFDGLNEEVEVIDTIEKLPEEKNNVLKEDMIKKINELVEKINEEL